MKLHYVSALKALIGRAALVPAGCALVPAGCAALVLAGCAGPVLAGCAGPVLAGCAGPVLAGSPPTVVTAVLLPDGRYSPMAIGEMGREAAHILKHSGVVLHWRLGASTEVSGGLLIVVQLRGQCEMDDAQVNMKSQALGWSHEVNGKMLPFSDLACDNIRAAIQPALPHSDVQSNVLLGRAMGRVLAHELYHIVADTSEHGEDGVAQPALSARELTSGQLELEAPDVAAIQSGLHEAAAR